MLNLIVMYGSRACEHDVSIITAVQAMDNLNRGKYRVIPVYIDQKGRWFTGDALRKMDFYPHFDEHAVTQCMIVPGPYDKAQLVKAKPGLFGGRGVICEIDCALMCFHGMNGEDGTMQGLLELYDVPYTSAGVLGSSTGMDKIAMKLIYKGCGLPVLDMCWFERGDWEQDRAAIIEKVEREIGYPAFVKPANLGSSIGISKAKDRKSLIDAIETAVAFDKRILVEVGVDKPDEVNCAAVGFGSDVTASVCEMPVSWEEFLTFDEKYMRGGSGSAKGGKLGGAKGGFGGAKGSTGGTKGGSTGGTKGGSAGGTKGGMQSLARQVPAPISDEMTADIQRMTREIFRVMDLKGVVRVDYIIDKAKGKVYVNEVNTIPGSLAFYLFEPMGIPYHQLLDKMVESAMEAYAQKRASSFSYGSAILDKVTTGSAGGAKR